MSTRLSSNDPVSLAKVADCLLNGGVAIIPTDTVYGLAAHPGHAAAMRRLQTLKARQAPKPVALLVDSAGVVETFTAPLPLPAAAAALMACFWPGALTLVLDTPGGAEGFRVPAHGLCRRLIKACGGALRVTSANLAGGMPATSAEEALAALGLTADVLLDDGPSPGGTASTVVRVTPGNLATVLRAGAIPQAECERAIMRRG